MKKPTYKIQHSMNDIWAVIKTSFKPITVKEHNTEHTIEQFYDVKNFQVFKGSIKDCYNYLKYLKKINKLNK